LTIGNLTAIQWTVLSGSIDLSSLDQSLLTGTTNGQSFIVVPKVNLQQNLTYTIQVAMTATSGKIGTDSITLKTTSAIQGGQFSVTPNKGEAFKQDFDVTYSGWSAQYGSLMFDLVFYREANMTVNKHDAVLKQSPHFLQTTFMIDIC
jgi:REJ domain